MNRLFLLALAFIAGSLALRIEVPFTKPLENGGKHWVLLVAGSNGWYNYRHQADVCHAYQVMKDHGIPEENIITMMYDDIAENSQNPTKGIIINRPNGPDVYKGVKVDYKGEDVTPEVFLNVLQGKKEALRGVGTGRVIESGPNDHIFVNFVDHGAPGLVAFPSEELHARQLNSALKSMFQQKRYNQMVLYIEACESGSMFQGLLPKNINIFATTAANGEESSYAVYYDKLRGTYLGDVYSVKWMENSDVANLNVETLAQQFNLVKKETNTSHVQEFGDLSIAKEPVGDFQGNTPSPRNVYYPKIPLDSVRSHDVEIHVIRNKIRDAETEEKKAALYEQLNAHMEYRDSISVQMKNIAAVALNHEHRLVSEALSVRTGEINFECYESAVKFYSANCNKINSNTFALRMLYVLQNICNLADFKVETLFSAMTKVC